MTTDYRYFYLLIIALALFSPSCNSSKESTATITGSFAIDAPDGDLFTAVDPISCAETVTSVVATADVAEAASATVGGDCAFSLSVPAGKAIGLTFVSGETSAVHLHANPYFGENAKPEQYLTRFRINGGVAFDMGRIRLLGAYAFSENTPLATLDADKDGIPDGFDADYDLLGLVTQADVDEDTIANGADNCPFETNAGQADGDGDGVGDACEIGSFPLKGSFSYSLVKVSTGAELAYLQANKATLEASDGMITITDTGLTRGPITMKGLWVKLGSTVTMMDRSGVLTLTEIPAGVAVAGVYDQLSSPGPLAWLPLYKLGSGSTTPIHMTGFFPQPCGMDDYVSCSTVTEGRSDPVAATDNDPCNHDYNANSCCLDYDGPTGGSDKSFGLTAYLGSTCERYVDNGCCAFEGGDVAFRAYAVWATLKTVVGYDYDPLYMPRQCYRSHMRRNCQWIDIYSQGYGLYLSATEPSESSQPSPALPWPLPIPGQSGDTYTEEISVGCGEEKTLYLFNNLCTNESEVTFEGNGSLDPVGTIDHSLVGRRHKYLNTLTYTAPAGPTVDIVTATARGFTRKVEITVGCSVIATVPPVTETTEPTPTPTPVTTEPTVSANCTGVTHHSGYSEVLVCVRWNDVPEGTEMKVIMGSQTQTASVKADGSACASFTIYSYGPYSGTAGVTTDGGIAAISWDITVGSGAVACSM